MTTPALRRPTVPARFLGGVRLLGSGLRMWLTDPRIMFMGAIPALIVSAVYLTGIVVLVVNIDGLASTITPFADSWDEGVRTVVRAAASLALLAAALVIVVYTFTTITLAVGSPFYERISRTVEERLGGIDSPVELTFWRGVGRGLVDAVRILATTLGVAIVLLVLGFIPVVGQILVPVLGALAGGWFLALELTAFSFEARGFTGSAKRRALSADRARSLGLGVATYLVFFIPFAAVVIMPAAVAGGTMLARSATTAGDAVATTPAG
ncbi:CysZ protein [Conyzicola lurida]|uniref:CysZ protein n=1 Tax=Conyzicola lurida TaxID=1172621 RepID=A0A841ANB4_9MICO|nr:EI24 domain-containing protein [Conyzicola lurida]MBB5843241.1 CysZ protein [Conyzicola lurida]